MVDPYAIVRRLTGYELISPKDAQLLTEAVDGLIGEIGSKDARIADLEAENERLRNMLNGYGKLDAELAIAERRIEALSRLSKQVVTEAMVEAAVQAVRQYTRDTLFIDEHRELVRTALKAAMEAGRHD